jgi:hypothetical protein
MCCFTGFGSGENKKHRTEKHFTVLASGVTPSHSVGSAGSPLGPVGLPPSLYKNNRRSWANRQTPVSFTKDARPHLACRAPVA